MSEYVEDVLGPGYEMRRLRLSKGRRASLVRRRAQGLRAAAPRDNTEGAQTGTGQQMAGAESRRAGGAAARGAVLYVHGFTDYFFQTHLAERINALGLDFYALDLRGYGRSLTESDVPYHVTDLRDYDEELDLAWEALRRDGHENVVLMAHSTGGLLVPLWVSRRPYVHPAAMVFNSPWFDLAGSNADRTVTTWVVRAIGRVAPMYVIPRELGSVYGQSLHADHHGEWSYDVAWKPVTALPIRAGWLAAVRRGHARLHRGLELDVPTLVMRSDASALGLREFSQRAMRADTVLDVRHMSRWAPKIGPRTEVAVVPGGMHDLFLSAAPVRETAFTVLQTWLVATLQLPPPPAVGGHGQEAR